MTIVTPTQVRARNAVARAVKAGTLVRPTRCSSCGARGLREWDGVIAALLKATEAIVGGAQMAKATLRDVKDERRTA
mgnify:CR=1 FL=1